MPWCDDCERFLSPNSLRPDGACPTCGTKVAEPAVEPVAEAGSETGAATGNEEYKAPWHFKLMVVALVAYLGWRAYQIIERLMT